MGEEATLKPFSKNATFEEIEALYTELFKLDCVKEGKVSGEALEALPTLTTRQQVQSVFRKLALLLTPDRGGSNLGEIHTSLNFEKEKLEIAMRELNNAMDQFPRKNNS
ncbi:MAG: hypothetical protein HEQ32_07895 [Vampirovibrio sp.]